MGRATEQFAGSGAGRRRSSPRLSAAAARCGCLLANVAGLTIISMGTVCTVAPSRRRDNLLDPDAGRRHSGIARSFRPARRDQKRLPAFASSPSSRCPSSKCCQSAMANIWIFANPALWPRPLVQHRSGRLEQTQSRDLLDHILGTDTILPSRWRSMTIRYFGRFGAGPTRRYLLRSRMTTWPRSPASRPYMA